MPEPDPIRRHLHAAEDPKPSPLSAEADAIVETVVLWARMRLAKLAFRLVMRHLATTRSVEDAYVSALEELPDGPDKDWALAFLGAELDRRNNTRAEY